MKNVILALLFALTIMSPILAEEPVDYVNPFIGTTNFGATNPGATTPNAMMSVSPFNVMGYDENKYDKDKRWWSTPYEYHNDILTGFAHVNLSGVGCPDLGSLLTMPTTGDLEVDYRKYGSTISGQVAKAGYYSTYIDKYGIKVEATASLRSSIERYTFPAGDGNILINLGEGLTNESGAMIRRVGDNSIEGMKLMGTFCYNARAVYPIYFAMEVSKSPSRSGYWKMQRHSEVEAQWNKDAGKYKIYNDYDREMAGDDIGYFFSFDSLEEGEQIEVHIGVSMVSMDNARMNLRHELQNLNFDELYDQARNSWSEELSRIEVKGGSEDEKTIFYTALYHALIHPNILNDVNGEYPLMESHNTGFTNSNRYTVFSLWDTYRNLHQLLTLVYPTKQLDMIRSMIDIYNEWGWLPKWELYGRETFTMSGDPATLVIVDSWMKGLRGFDIDLAYQAMMKSATTEAQNNKMRPDIDPYIKRGYIPVGHLSVDIAGDNSVSRALEYYIADYALSTLADSLGYSADAKMLHERSLGYKNYFCHEMGLLRPKLQDGRFYEPFNPRDGENFQHAVGFHEGSAWNYTFFVPHDIYGLSKLMGGKKSFVEKLQMVFDTGLYDPTNEPDIAYPYLFSYFKGEEWRTQREVKRLLKEHYTTAPDGIPGNDDTGTISAWAIFSMMGLYPDTPGSPYYTLTTPAFDQVKINTPSGEIIIETRGEGDYIDRIYLDGVKFNKYRISHQELISKKIITLHLKQR
ncbi:MAG: GH92 family glycosyl hydrolase [Rikenellaceae bacterium]